jgi:hypothetical protein
LEDEDEWGMPDFDDDEPDYDWYGDDETDEEEGSESMSGWGEDFMFREDNSASVCSRMFMSGFGERYPSSRLSPNGESDDHAKDLDEFKAVMVRTAKLWDKRWASKKKDCWSNQSIHRMAFIEAVTSHLQPKAEEYLEQLGFTKIGPFKKLKHPDSDITLWVMGCPEFMEAIGYEGDNK